MRGQKSMYQWQTTQETVEDLSGKISVKKRDNASIFRLQKDSIKRNDEQISTLRMTVKDAHQDLAKMLNKDYQVIQTALDSKRETQLQCKGYDAHRALKELNEDVCVEGKRLNHFIHQKECRMRRLQDLRLHYRDFRLLEESNFEKEDQKRVRLLMTKYDKMIMKRNTASFIQSTYRKTLSKLNRDALTMHKQLDGIEQTVVSSKTEGVELNEIYRAAKTGQDEFRAKRMALEEDVFHSKQVRDKTIVETRKRAKESSEIPDIGTTTRAHNDFLNSGGNKAKKSHLNRPSVQLDKLIPIIKMFSTVTNTVTASDIPIAYKRQIEHFDIMSAQSVELAEKLQKKVKLVADAQNRLTDAKYHQAENARSLGTTIRQLKDKCNFCTSQTISQNDEHDRLQLILERVSDAVVAVVENLIPTKVSGSNFDTASITSTDLSLAQQVQVINDKLESIQAVIVQHAINIENGGPEADAESEGRVSTSSKTESSTEITSDQVDEVMLRLKHKYMDGVRITIATDEDPSTSDNFILDDMNLNENYITREEIKRFGSTAQKLKSNGKR